MKRGEFEVTVTQKALLREAMRRWNLRREFNEPIGQTLLTAWTGLGSATHYKPVFDAGLMEPVHGPNKGNSIWWKLTKKGVLAIVMLGWTEGELYEEEIG